MACVPSHIYMRDHHLICFHSAGRERITSHYSPCPGEGTCHKVCRSYPSLFCALPSFSKSETKALFGTGCLEWGSEETAQQFDPESAPTEQQGSRPGQVSDLAEATLKPAGSRTRDVIFIFPKFTWTANPCQFPEAFLSKGEKKPAIWI